MKSRDALPQLTALLNLRKTLSEADFMERVVRIVQRLPDEEATKVYEILLARDEMKGQLIH